MAKDPKAGALHKLFVLEANYANATAAKTETRRQLDLAILEAVKLGLSKAEIGRAVGTTGQRVSQLIAKSE